MAKAHLILFGQIFPIKTIDLNLITIQESQDYMIRMTTKMHSSTFL